MSVNKKENSITRKTLTYFCTLKCAAT